MLFRVWNVCLVYLGVSRFFDGITLFIAMTDVQLLSILQKFRYPNFNLDEFSFSLVHKEEHDVWHYVVTFENCVVALTVYGIDTTEHCGPLSNIDLVHFVWENFFRLLQKTHIGSLTSRRC